MSSGYIGVIGCTHLGDIYSPVQKNIITRLDQTIYVKSAEHPTKVGAGEPMFWNATKSGYSNVMVGTKDSFVGISQHSNNSVLGNPDMEAYAMVLYRQLNCQVWIPGRYSQGDLLKGSATGFWEITLDREEALVIVENNYRDDVLYTPMGDKRSGCLVSFLKN